MPCHLPLFSNTNFLEAKTNFSNVISNCSPCRVSKNISLELPSFDGKRSFVYHHHVVLHNASSLPPLLVLAACFARTCDCLLSVDTAHLFVVSLRTLAHTALRATQKHVHVAVPSCTVPHAVPRLLAHFILPPPLSHSSSSS